MTQDIPQWAINEAVRRLDVEHLAQFPGATNVYSRDEEPAKKFGQVRIIARLIAAHEEPPVDPLWAEAMAFTNDHGWNGDSPIRPMVKFAHAAMLRGIELAKEPLT